MHRPVRTLLAMGALLVALAASPPLAAANHLSGSGLPAYGLNSFWAEGLADQPLGLQDLDRMNAAHIGLYRARFRQDRVLSNGSYSQWAQLDRLAREAANRGASLVPVVINMPGDIYTPPRTRGQRNEFASFVAAAAKRYGSAGSFWATCGCPKRPALVWEIWNEQNFSAYWSTPNPSEYGLLVKAVSDKLRRADRQARVMLGGLGYARSYDGTNAYDPDAFLRQTVPAAGLTSFDAVALHSYHGTVSSGLTAIGNSVATLRSAGATRQQVWVNEFGHTSRLDDPSTTTVNEQEQSERSQQLWLEGMADGLASHRSDWGLGPLFWYALRDSHLSSDPRLGLRRTSSDNLDAGAKPAWDSYAARSSAAQPLPLPALP